MKLQRNISNLGLLFAAIGGIIGSGWLFGPLYVAQCAGPAAILSWAIGGILMTFIGLTFAELASAFPETGGMIHFADLSHGPAVSFTIGWMVWLSSAAVAPIETMALLQYSANYIPGLVHKVDGATVLTGSGVVVASMVMLLMCVLNYFGAQFFSRSSSAIVVFKLIVPILTVIVLVWMGFNFANFHRVGGFMPYGWEGVLQALPMGGVIFSFIGYSPAIQMGGEARNPQRAIPYAILGSTLFCLVLYVLLQGAFIGSLKPEYLAQGWSHLSFTGESGPFAGILAALGVYWLVIVIYADAVVSPFGTAYIYTASTARVNYGLAQVNFFPKALTKLNRHGAPMVAIFVNFAVGLILFLPFPGWQKLVGFLVSCFVIAYSIGPIALLGLRRLMPDHPRSFKLRHPRLMACLAFYTCNLMVYWTGWDTVKKLLIALLLGFAVLLWRVLAGKIQWRSLWAQGWWLPIYVIGIGIITKLGAFGGTKEIGFGMDLVVLAIFSLVILWLTTLVRSPAKAMEEAV